MAISSKKWLYVLLTENGASYFVDSNGDVQISLIPKPISNMFEGWSDIVINYGRSAKYFGLERTYTSTYKFVKDGATILRHLLYDTRSIESKVYLGLLKWNGETNGTFELYYKAEIDLSTANDDPKTGVTVEVMQDGPAKYIKTNESVVYEIDVNELTLNLDGVRFTDTFNYFSVGTTPVDKDTVAMVPVNFVNNEGQNVNVKQGDSFFEQITGSIPTFLTNSGNYFFSSQDTITLRVTGTFTVRVAGGSLPFKLSIYCYPSLPPALPETIVGEELAGSPGDYTYTLTNQPITVSRDGKVFLVLDTGITSFSPTAQVLETNFKVTFDSRFQETQCQAIRPLTLGQRLMEKMTDGRFTLSSTLLDENQHLVATCGDAIRGIAGAKIKTSWSDFFSSYSKILNGALGVNYNTQTAEFETKEYFFNNATEIIDIGEVAELAIEVAKETLFNSIKVGYPDQKIEEGVARQEVNAGQEYRTPITRINKQLDLIVPYRTDIFGIERIRQQFTTLPNTDAQGDNSVFIINIERTEDPGGGWNVFRADYSFIEGGTNQDTWYNIEQLTPKRILDANGSLISGGLYALPNELISFVSGDKNTALITTLSGVTVVENGNRRVNQLASSYYRPFLLKFNTKIPQNIVSLLQQAGRGYVTGTFQGVRFYGFPQEVSVKPAFEEAQEMTLLCSSLTDPAVFKTINDQAIILEDVGIISHRLPVKFLQVGESYPLQYHFKQMDIDFFQNRIGQYSQKRPYFQKWQTNDSFQIQFIVQNIAVEVVIIDCNGTQVDTVTMTQTASSALTADQQLYVGTVDWSGLNAGETYYILATFGTGLTAKQFVSEPQVLATDWPNTLLFECSNDQNDRDMIWLLPAGAIFTNKLRVEGFIQEFQPGGRLSQYEDEPLDIVNLDNEPTRSYQLLVGTDFGIPDWIADKVNRFLMLDSVRIEGFGYTLDRESRLEPVYTPGVPTASWTATIREARNRLGIAIDASGQNDSPLTVEHDINTRGFSSTESPANQQDTIIQITEIE